jgi:hypothetical protein
MRSTNLQFFTAAVFCAAIGAALPADSRSSEPAPPLRPSLGGDAALASALTAAPATTAAAKAVSTAAVSAGGSRAARVQRALHELVSSVTQQSHPLALRYAFEAYYNYKAAHPERVRKPYLYFVDFGLDARTPRGYVFDMDNLRVVDGPFTVAHGRGSGSKDGIPTRFSNRPSSAATSLGLFLTQESYSFVGHDAGQPYRSIGLRLAGVSGGFNDRARSRGVVVHGAPYVTPSGAGRSQGCPAMEPERAWELIPRISGGGMVFLFSPNDPNWLAGDPWTHDSSAGDEGLEG